MSKRIPRKHIALHTEMIDRCPTLSATRPSDVTFSKKCVGNAIYVPEKHRVDVLAAFELGIEVNANSSSAAGKAIVANLTEATRRLNRVIYDTPATTSAHAGNGVDHSSASDPRKQQLLGGTSLSSGAAAN